MRTIHLMLHFIPAGAKLTNTCRTCWVCYNKQPVSGWLAPSPQTCRVHALQGTQTTPRTKVLQQLSEQPIVFDYVDEQSGGVGVQWKSLPYFQKANMIDALPAKHCACPQVVYDLREKLLRTETTLSFIKALLLKVT